MSFAQFIAASALWGLGLGVAVAAPPVAKLYRLDFPKVQLNERQWQALDEVHFTLACGHIESIAFIPERWNVEIVRSISAVEEFRATAGLGTARLLLKEIERFSGSIIVSDNTGEDCFKLSGALIIGGGEYFEAKLSNANLRAVK